MPLNIYLISLDIVFISLDIGFVTLDIDYTRLVIHYAVRFKFHAFRGRICAIIFFSHAVHCSYTIIGFKESPKQ